MISKSFLKSSVIFTVGGALPMVASIILLPFYTNLLSHTQYLQVAFYISVSLLFQVLFSYSMESYFGIEYTRLSEEPARQKQFIGTVSALLLVIGFVLLSASAIAGDFLFKRIFKSEFEISFWPYGFYSVLTAFFNSYFKTASVCLIYKNRPRTFMLANIVNFLVTLIISVGGIYLFPNSIVGPIYGRLISGLVIFLMAQFIFSSNGVFKLDRSFLPEIVRFCSPYLIFALSAWVLGQIDRYFLQEFVEKVDINAYDLILKCFFGIEFLQNSISAIIFPKVYEIWTKNKNNSTTPESNRYFNVFTAVNIFQLILFCLAIPVIYKVFITKEGFDRAEVYIGILSAGYALRSIINFYISTILYTKSTGVLLKIFGLSALFQIAITYVAVLKFGVMGAIYAGLITKVIQVILCTQFTRGIFIYQFNYYKIIALPFAFILINLAQFYFFREYQWYLYALQLLVFTTLFYLIFRKEIRLVIAQYLK